MAGRSALSGILVLCCLAASGCERRGEVIVLDGEEAVEDVRAGAREAEREAEEAGAEIGEAGRRAGRELEEVGREVGSHLEVAGRELEREARELGRELEPAAADMQLSARIKAKLVADPEINPLQVDVDTVDGVVTLNGKVRTAAALAEAEKHARNTPGVVAVRNLLTVDPNAPPI